MKVNELMLNDWVKVKGSKSKALCYKVDVISNFGFYDAITCGEYDFQEEDIEPIPLTEEILKKNGFVQVEDGIKQYDFPEGAWQNDKFLYGLDYNHRGMFYTFSNNPEEDGLINQIYGIFFVHDLQHCLRLCELSDLADNFKV